jgi:hypothetical protein
MPDFNIPANCWFRKANSSYFTVYFDKGGPCSSRPDANLARTILLLAGVGAELAGFGMRFAIFVPLLIVPVLTGESWAARWAASAGFI